MTERVLTLKDMTRGSGCTPRTVRYYERQGLLRALRSAGGHRLFPESELERLSFIISLREAGWSLEEVTEFLAVRDGDHADAVSLAALETTISGQLERLDRKIELLQQLRTDLKSTAQLLAVCRACTSVKEHVECRTCERLPSLERLPRSFRLIWRARELDGNRVYDEKSADGEGLDGSDDLQ